MSKISSSSPVGIALIAMSVEVPSFVNCTQSRIANERVILGAPADVVSCMIAERTFARTSGDDIEIVFHKNFFDTSPHSLLTVSVRRRSQLDSRLKTRSTMSIGS